MQNAQLQIQGTVEEISWPDAGSVFASSISSVSPPSSKCSKANSILSNVSSVKRQEAAAEYAATQAVLKIMAEQEYHREKLPRLEAEDKLIATDEEAAALAHHVQAEETEHRIEKTARRTCSKKTVCRRLKEGA